MTTLRERYQARIDELESLSKELEAGNRPGDAGPVVGRVLEAAGDLLRRRAAFAVEEAMVDGALKLLPRDGLESWAAAITADALAERVSRAASHAVEAVFPEVDEDAPTWVSWAMADLQARDRLESALAALERLSSKGHAEAGGLAGKLRDVAKKVDRTARAALPALTAVNEARRAEAELLDEPVRAAAWWYCERNAATEDGLVGKLGSGKGDGLAGAESAVHQQVTKRRRRRVSFDELLDIDLGIASAADAAMLRNQARVDPELALTLAAMDAGEQAIAELDGAGAQEVPPVSERPAPQVVAERPQFRLLMFRTRARVQVVAQPRGGARLAAAAVHLPDGSAPIEGHSGEQGLEIELGPPERYAGQTVRVMVRLATGETVASEVRL